MVIVIVVNKKQYPSELTDSQWDIIQELIPQAKSRGRSRSLDIRKVVNGILYIVVGGVQWRMLPKECPKWQSVYYYFRTWRDNRIWKRIHDTIRARVRQKDGRHKHPTAGSLDSQSVKTSVNPGKVRGFDGGKLITGRKRHILVDSNGLLLAVLVTAASVTDRNGACQLLQNTGGFCKKLRLIWVDGGYTGPLLQWVSAHFCFRLQPMLRPKGQKGFILLARRWVVERTFSWFGHYRRLSKDYERLPASSEAFIQIAMTRNMLRRLAPK